MIASKTQKITTELIKIINDWNEYSKEIYGYSKNEAENFLKRLQTGIYNSVLKTQYWFAPPPQLDKLIKIEVAKKSIKSLTNITEENYIVYSYIQEIKDHLEFIYYWNKAYHLDYKTKEKNFNQPPASTTEQEQFDTLYKIVLNTNYTWYDAKNISKSLKEINIKENKDFPHNIKEISKIFNNKPTPLHKNYNDKIKYSTNILNLNKIVHNLLEQLTKNNINEFLKNKKESIYEEYIRQQIINCKISNIKEIKVMLQSLLTEKKCMDLSELDITQPLLTTLRKHYTYIYKHTTELEFLEETTEILEKMKMHYKKDENKIYKITLIYNAILISNGIIPIILSPEILKLKEKELIKTILEETINQTKLFNQENKG